MTAIYTPRDWDSQPPLVFPAYKSTLRRGPTRPLIPIAPSLSELTGPVYGHEAVGRARSRSDQERRQERRAARASASW